MDESFLYKSMFAWYKEMVDLDQTVSDETINIAAQAICEKVNFPTSHITEEWVSRFKDRYGIRTETSPAFPLWRQVPKKRKERISTPEPSQELIDRRARLGKSYAVDEESDHGDSDKDSLCGFSFEDLCSVPEYKPHRCPHCPERYLWGHQLREHMKCHSDIKKYLCTTCGKNYKSPHNLKIHMRVHTGDRPYVCPTCKKGFRERSALRKHIRIHTGERPFLCSDCGSAFISKTQLNIHIKTHHGPFGFGNRSRNAQKRKKIHTSQPSANTATVSSNLHGSRCQSGEPHSTATSTSAQDSCSSVPVPTESHCMAGDASHGGIASPVQPAPSLALGQPPLPQLLPGTGYYVPMSTAGSITSGTPMLPSPSQYSPATSGYQYRPAGGMDLPQPAGHLPHDFVQGSPQPYQCQDYHYNA